MKTQYFTCEEWMNAKSFDPVLMVSGDCYFLLTRDGKKILTAMKSKSMFAYGDKLREISESEAALLI